jgi:hypothetical protein
MSILTWPEDIVPVDLNWWLEYNTTTFTSPLTKSVQTLQLPGARWKAEATVKNLTGTDLKQFTAFLSSLRGQAGRFYFAPTICRNTNVPTNVTVMGSDQTGSSLLTTGWNANTTVLTTGDYFSVVTPIGVELKQLTQDAVSTETGTAMLYFAPVLRNSPSDGAEIIVDSPKCVMKLDDDSQVKGAYSIGVFGAFSIAMTEVIYA